MIKPKDFIEERDNGYIAGDYTPNQVYELMEQYAKAYHAEKESKVLKDWRKWEDAILSFLRSHSGLRVKFNTHIEEWNILKKLPKSAYERKK